MWGSVPHVCVHRGGGVGICAPQGGGGVGICAPHVRPPGGGVGICAPRDGVVWGSVPHMGVHRGVVWGSVPHSTGRCGDMWPTGGVVWGSVPHMEGVQEALWGCMPHTRGWCGEVCPTRGADGTLCRGTIAAMALPALDCGGMKAVVASTADAFRWLQHGCSRLTADNLERLGPGRGTKCKQTHSNYTDNSMIKHKTVNGKQ